MVISQPGPAREPPSLCRSPRRICICYDYYFYLILRQLTNVFIGIAYYLYWVLTFYNQYHLAIHFFAVLFRRGAPIISR